MTLVRTTLFALFVGACAAAVPRSESAADAAEPALPPLPWDSEQSPPPSPHTPRIALTGGTVMTAAGHTIEAGLVVIEDGRIVSVGEGPAPEGAQVIDASGRFVTPGLIDTHSHMGVYASPGVVATSDGNEATDPVTPQVWAGDSFWPQDPALPRALAGGVTTIQVLPGSANLIGGRGVTLKLRPGRSVSEMRFAGAPDTLKMACGENPKRVYGGRDSAPSTRMGNMAGTRAAFQKAKEYGTEWRTWQLEHQQWQRKRTAYERAQGEGGPGHGSEDEDVPEDPGPSPKPPERDFGLEALLGVIEGRVLVQMHCYRADEMARMLEVAREFGFRIRSFHHAVEAYKIRDLLAETRTGVSTWADWWGFKLEAFDAIVENLALLSESHVPAVLHSDSAMLVQRLNQEAAKAMAAGRHAGIEVTEDTALRWITANAAWVLGIGERTGTLEPGKMADVVVWSGHPFSVYTRADLVFVDGVLRYDRSKVPTETDFELGLGAGPEGS